jgi:hypothetical protein
MADVPQSQTCFGTSKNGAFFRGESSALEGGLWRVGRPHRKRVVFQKSLY